MADIFVSYTSSDKAWAHWIGLELERLGHVPHVHEWEIDAGGDIPAWMEERIQKADRVLCIVSSVYLTKDYSSWERRAAQWAAQSKRPNFVVPVFVEDCEAPVTLAHLKRCDLYGADEDEARIRLETYLAPAAKPSGPVQFPGAAKPVTQAPRGVPTAPFPGGKQPLSNIPIRIPTHFLGRDNAIAAIDAALRRGEGRVAIAALHGLRGVGKTTLAAAYAERRRADYRATWWIRAETDSTMRADLVALGVRLGWVAADEKEEPAVAIVRERLRDHDEALLLIYDNAMDAASVKPFLPIAGLVRVLVTSNFPAWRDLATPVEIGVWPTKVGADFLVLRTGFSDHRAEAEALSDALGGLPLAHEQAGAYCERLGSSFREYLELFEAEPVPTLADAEFADSEYGATVAKSFGMAIDQATKLHSVAEPLIRHAALLAPEWTPLFLFSEGREHFGEPLASLPAAGGLAKAVAALRDFALVERNEIEDERESAIRTPAIRLHRLVGLVAASRDDRPNVLAKRGALIRATASVYPDNLRERPKDWPRVRRLDGLAAKLVGPDIEPDEGLELVVADLLSSMGSYRQAVLADYEEAQRFFAAALQIRETSPGAGALKTLESINRLAWVFRDASKPADAARLFKRALDGYEKALDPQDPRLADSLDALGWLYLERRDLGDPRPPFERALAIRRAAFGPKALETVQSLNNVASLRADPRDLPAVHDLIEDALKIREAALGPEHLLVAESHQSLASLLQRMNDLRGAEDHFRQALAIRQRGAGENVLLIRESLNGLAFLLQVDDRFQEARPLFEKAVAISEKAFGEDHPQTATYLNNLGWLLLEARELDAAEAAFNRALSICQRKLREKGAETARTFNHLGLLQRERGDHEKAQMLFTRALTLYDEALGPHHSDTNNARRNLAEEWLAGGAPAEALRLAESALEALLKVLGPNDGWTREAARVKAGALDALSRADEATEVRGKYGLGSSPTRAKPA